MSVKNLIPLWKRKATKCKKMKLAKSKVALTWPAEWVRIQKFAIIHFQSNTFIWGILMDFFLILLTREHGDSDDLSKEWVLQCVRIFDSFLSSIMSPLTGQLCEETPPNFITVQLWAGKFVCLCVCVCVCDEHRHDCFTWLNSLDALPARLAVPPLWPFSENKWSLGGYCILHKMATSQQELNVHSTGQAN